MEKMTEQEKRLEANRLFAKFHNLIQDIGGELGQEAMVSILAKKCALIAIELRIEDIYNFELKDSVYFLQDVKKILEKKN